MRMYLEGVSRNVHRPASLPSFATLHPSPTEVLLLYPPNRALSPEPVFCLTDFYYGRSYARIVSAIGYNEHNANEVYVYNLTLAPEYIGGLSEARLHLRMPGRPRPVHTLRANAFPILTCLERAPVSAQGLALGRDELRRRAKVLRDDSGLRAQLIEAFETVREQREPSRYVEQQIYDRFISYADERLIESFHTSPWKDRLSIIDRLEDPGFVSLGFY